MIYEFFAHSTPSLYGEGDANSAAQLAGFMNIHRAINVWHVREVDKAPGPLMNIAAEIARHRTAQGG